MYVIWCYYRHTIRNYGQLTPQFLLIIGFAGILIFAVAGLAGAIWQQYQLAPPSDGMPPSSALGSSSEDAPSPSKNITKQQGTPARYYSSSDKDRIAEAFFELKEILNREARPLAEKAEVFGAGWQGRLQASNISSELFTTVLLQLDKYKSSASRIHALIYKDFLAKYQSYADLLTEVLGVTEDSFPTEHGPFIKFEEAAEYFSVRLEAIAAIYQNDPISRQHISLLLNPFAFSFVGAANGLDNWISDCEFQIKSKERAILKSSK